MENCVPIYLDGTIVMLGRDTVFGGFVELLSSSGGGTWDDTGWASDVETSNKISLLAFGSSHSKTGIEAGVVLLGPVGGERQEMLRGYDNVGENCQA